MGNGAISASPSKKSFTMRPKEISVSASPGNAPIEANENIVLHCSDEIRAFDDDLAISNKESGKAFFKKRAAFDSKVSRRPGSSSSNSSPPEKSSQNQFISSGHQPALSNSLSSHNQYIPSHQSQTHAHQPQDVKENTWFSRASTTPQQTPSPQKKRLQLSSSSINGEGDDGVRHYSDLQMDEV